MRQVNFPAMGILNPDTCLAAAIINYLVINGEVRTIEEARKYYERYCASPLLSEQNRGTNLWLMAAQVEYVTEGRYAATLLYPLPFEGANNLRYPDSDDVRKALRDIEQGRTHDSSLERCLEFGGRTYSEYDKAYIAAVDFDRMVVTPNHLPENILPKIPHAVAVLRKKTATDSITFYDYDGKTYQLEKDEILNCCAFLNIEKKH